MFNAVQVAAIIREYERRAAALGRYPPPTALALDVSEAVMELIEPLELLDGKAEAEDELGHVAFAVFHVRTQAIANMAIIAFSGGRPSEANFDRIRDVLSPAKIRRRIPVARNGGEASGVRFQFEFRMRRDSKARTCCAEPKAVAIAETLDAVLLGTAVRWRSSSQLTTPHRLNVSFISSHDAFMLPCDSCIAFFADPKDWPHVRLS